MFRWVIGGLLTCWTGFLLVAAPLNQMLYGWEWQWQMSIVGISALIVFASAIGLLRGREWARRVLLVVTYAAVALLVLNGATSFAQARGLTSSLVGVVLCLLMLAGLSLPSVKGGMAIKSEAAEQ